MPATSAVERGIEGEGPAMRRGLRLRRRHARSPGGWVAALTLGVWPAAAAAGVDAGAVLQQIRSAVLQPAQGVAVRDLVLETGLATLRLDEGALFPASPVGARPVEMVFIGRGRLLVEPPDEIEASQLELFTDASSLEGTFEEAVLVVARDEAARILLESRRGPVQDAAAGPRAAQIFERWKNSAERKLLNVEGALFLDAIGDPPMDGFFAAWFHSTRHKDFIYLVDPLEEEPVTLGQFVPLELSDEERREQRRELHAEQRRGRLIGLRVEDLGTWNTWLSGQVRGSDGRLLGGPPAPEPERYLLDVSIEPSERRISGNARIRLRAATAGRRGLVFRLFPDLEVQRVTDGSGTELPFTRSGREISVALRAPTVAAEILEVQIAYSGRIVERVAYKTFRLEGTEDWYPHTGNIDRATYDVTLHYPGLYDLLASGRQVETAEEPRRMRRVRHVLDRSAQEFTFELGNFDTWRGQAGHIEVTIAFNQLSKEHLGKPVKEQVREVVADALDYFEELFGTYPLDQLTVVSAPRQFSQGFLGFITLSDVQISEWMGGSRGALAWLLGGEDRRTIIAHEVAHQWWGNLIGWKTYRDQWLSESMASYSALLYMRHRLASEGRDMRGPLYGWRQEVMDTTRDGRSIDSLGPLVLGTRLNSTFSDSAYQTMVYYKGAVVLDSLARIFGEQVFLEMLGHMARAAAGRELSTAEFLAGLERMSAADLEWFARHYIYGTGYPDVHYTYAFDRRAQGGWVVRGTANQEATYRFKYRAAPINGGRFDVQRERIDQVQVENLRLVTPFEILVEQEGEKPRKALVKGRMLINGARHEYQIETEHKPLDFWIDRHGEALAVFVSETRHPKRVLLYHASDLAAEGRAQEAEAEFRRALAAPLEHDDVLEEERDAKARKLDESLLDARIHLGIADLYIEQERDADAWKELELGRSLVDYRRRRWIRAQAERIEARLRIRRGEHAAAFKLLKADYLRHGTRDDAEGLVLLAIAARATGNTEEFERAVELASERGADLSALVKK
jgi:hypothetical protein